MRRRRSRSSTFGAADDAASASFSPSHRDDNNNNHDDDEEADRIIMRRTTPLATTSGAEYSSGGQPTAASSHLARLMQGGDRGGGPAFIDLSDFGTPLIISPVGGRVDVLRVNISLFFGDEGDLALGSAALLRRNNNNNKQGARSTMFHVQRLVRATVDAQTAARVRGQEIRCASRIRQQLLLLDAATPFCSSSSLPPPFLWDGGGASAISALPPPLDSQGGSGLWNCCYEDHVVERDANQALTLWVTTRERWSDKPADWVPGPMALGMITAMPAFAASSVSLDDEKDDNWTVHWLVNMGPLTGADAVAASATACDDNMSA